MSVSESIHSLTLAATLVRRRARHQVDVFVGMMIEQGRMPVLHIGVEEVDAGVPVNRENGHLVEKDGLVCSLSLGKGSKFIT
jgi:hypothetical protein